MFSAFRQRGLLVTVLTSVAAVVIALLVGAIFILLSQQNPITAYRALIDGAFGSRRAIGETLAASTPYIFGGLSFAVAYDNRPGTWMFHCHILDHSDAGMMGMVELAR